MDMFEKGLAGSPVGDYPWTKTVVNRPVDLPSHINPYDVYTPDPWHLLGLQDMEWAAPIVKGSK
jgi:hypothetical protein